MNLFDWLVGQKKGVERNIKPDVVSMETYCLGRAVRNKPDQLLRAEAEQPKFGL